jgi:hypothetical protein
MVARALWRYRRWRAAHYLWAADLAYRRWPTPGNATALERAAVAARRVEAGRP